MAAPSYIPRRVLVGPDGLDVDPRVSNVTTRFREAFEAYTPGAKWAQVRGAGDIIQLDGNAVASSYLVISKDPLTADSLSSIETTAPFAMPVETNTGLSLSQRAVGQEFVVEVVDTDTPAAPLADSPITTIQQATTTLTVTTASPHGLRPGYRVGIRGVSDSRFNYPALVVATTPSLTSFTCTAGPMGTIPSVTAGPFASGSVYSRASLAGAPNGCAMIMENTTATQASFYTRSEAGDPLPSGAAGGNHSVTIGSTASVQAIAAALTYAFQPTTDYKLLMQPERVQWSDSAVDTQSASAARATRSQVVPDPAALYKYRIRATNNKSLTVPVAQIVSATKTGTTTATIVTDVPHGLTVADLVTIYGVRDQANFANLTGATAPLSIVNATTFTIGIGIAASAVSYGGYISRINGGNLQAGVVGQVLQNISRASNLVFLTANTTISGFSIGDYVNLVGVRESVAGTTVGLDGPYRVRDVSGPTAALEPIGNAPTGADIASTNCGGGIIKRTDLRISYVRIFDFVRERVELISRPATDQAASAPVNVQNTPAVTLSSGSLTGGTIAEDAAAGLNPIVVGGVVRAAVPPITFAAGDAVRDTMTSSGAKVVAIHAVPEAQWSYSGAAVVATTDVVLAAAAGASLRRYITALQIKNSNAVPTEVVLKDGSTVIWRGHLSANMLNADTINFDVPLKTTGNAALNFAAITTAANIYVAAQGFTAP